MQPLALHFDFSQQPLPGDPDMSRFRHDLAVNLEKALGGPENGRWRGGRYARGVVTIFLEVPDIPFAMQRINDLLVRKGLADRLTIGTGGEWISSLELEDLISRHPAVSEAVVIGVPDAKWGERPLALVVLKADAQTSADELKASFAKFAEDGVIPKYGVPDRVLIVESIAKTRVGKINKRQLRVDYK